MHALRKKWIYLAFVLIGSVISAAVQAEDLAAAVSAGKVTVTFHGTGGSSGDSIEAVVRRADKGADILELSVAPGTRLQSGNSSAQNMVIAAVKGQAMGENTYSPASVIEVGNTSRTYVLEAYCSDFEKENPSSATQFTLGRVDPVLACILSEASQLSVAAKQAAVWIYTDKATFRHVNQKFTVSQSDWDAAAAIVTKCASKGQRGKEAVGGQKPTQP